MHRAALMAMLLAACAVPTGSPVDVCDGSWRGVESVVVVPSSAGERQAVAITCMRQVDENRVRIGFEMPVGPDCFQLTAVDVVEAADAVSLSLWLSRIDDPAAGACPSTAQRTATEVDLQAPVGQRRLLDGGAAS